MLHSVEKSHSLLHENGSHIRKCNELKENIKKEYSNTRAKMWSIDAKEIETMRDFYFWNSIRSKTLDNGLKWKTHIFLDLVLVFTYNFFFFSNSSLPFLRFRVFFFIPLFLSILSLCVKISLFINGTNRAISVTSKCRLPSFSFQFIRRINRLCYFQIHEK